MRCCLALATLALTVLGSPAMAACPAYLDVDIRRLHAQDSVNLCHVAGGRPVVVINTASHCGFTPQFRELEALNQEYAKQGVVFIGFPSDDFRQEADAEAETAEVCYVNYGVSFLMTRPVHVRGDDAHPLFRALAEQGGAPKWNFYKFLLDADGRLVATFPSTVKPGSAEFRQALDGIVRRNGEP